MHRTNSARATNKRKGRFYKVKLDHSNIYLKKGVKGAEICIELPDSRDYIHCNELPLDIALYYKTDLLKQKIGSWNTKIEPDGTYYRVKTTLRCREQLDGENTEDLVFHSRKLNLNDAEFEYFILTSNTEEADG